MSFSSPLAQLSSTDGVRFEIQGSCIDMRLELPQFVDHQLFFTTAQATQQLNDPLFVTGGHFPKALKTGLCELDGVSAPVSRVGCAHHQPLPLELVCNTGDVAS